MEKHWKTDNDKREYAGSWDLAVLENGQQNYVSKIITVVSCKREEVNKYDKPMVNGKYQTETHFVLRTKELKPIIMNATNMSNAEKAIGNGFYETWHDCKIKIYVERGVRQPGTKKSDNITTDALRISPAPVKVATAKCECCGKEIPKSIYDGTKEKCGFGVCSAACRDKMTGGENETNNN